jgi:hypothetical protein
MKLKRGRGYQFELRAERHRGDRFLAGPPSNPQSNHMADLIWGCGKLMN